MLEFDPKLVEGSQYDRNKQTQLSNLITFTRYRYITKHLSKHLTSCKFFPAVKTGHGPSKIYVQVASKNGNLVTQI